MNDMLKYSIDLYRRREAEDNSGLYLIVRVDSDRYINEYNLYLKSHVFEPNSYKLDEWSTSWEIHKSDAKMFHKELAEQIVNNNPGCKLLKVEFKES